MRRGVVLALVLATAMPAVSWAAPKDDEEEEEDEEEEADTPPKKDDEEDSGDEEEAEAKPAAKEEEEEEEVDSDAGLRPKQNLTGHDLGTQKKTSEFEQNRFFVDKVDSEKTEKGTLVQGSIASSSFFYKEAGGAYPNITAGENVGPARLFTELRLQTDFRHIKASRWEARIDGRARFVGGGGTNIAQTPENHIQSGLTGQNEYEIRELWLTRVGKRSDLFFGRQFIPDLGGVKIDGIRIDYAKSAKLTLLGFAGLYPLRGSRSITTDYATLKDPNGNDAGKFIPTAGFGGAYRTINAYGAIGGVAQVPLQKETARFYITSTGYLRSGSKLDFYHFVLLDVLGAIAQSGTGPPIQLTNLSAGVNFKPDQRLRLTANVNRVDTETLNVQAGEFLGTIDTDTANPNYAGNKVVQNETLLLRLATTSARAGVSAGLGKQQRFELSTSVTYRERQSFQLAPPVPTMTNPIINIPAAKSVEVWGSFVDRRSFKGARIGLDAARSFGIGDTSYQRSNTQTVRLFVLKEIRDGRGEVETEVSYAKVLNDAANSTTACVNAGMPPIETLVNACYGHSTNTLISAGAQLVYRLKADWLGIANLYLLRTTNQSPNPNPMMPAVNDPAVIGLTGFLRIAKRF